MATLICDRYRFAYVHIPKCAGTSLSVALKKHVTWDERFLGARPDPETGERPYLSHPELGRLNGPHVPLVTMRDCFPDAFAKLGSYAAYAITRDPAPRFPSAVAQHVREFRGGEIHEYQPEELEAVVEDCIAALRKNPVNPGLAYMHLLRQSDFVWLDGDRITDFVYPMEALDEMTGDISERFGFPLELHRRSSNPTEAPLSGPMGALQKGVARVSKATMPPGFHEQVRQFVRGYERRRSSSKTGAVFASDRVRDFVAEFYAQDAELYARAREWVAGRHLRRSRATAGEAPA